MGGGIGSMNGSTAIIRENTCFENFFAGIGHENASPLVEMNRCHGNIRAGIGVSEGACPTVRNNFCYENRRAGIGIRTGANTRPFVEQNECRNNGMAGIGVEEKAEPVISANRCFLNQLAGIGVRGQARPVITGNECFENSAAGIGLETGNNTQVVGNHCHDNKAAGIEFSGEGRNCALLTGNRVIDNAAVAVGINSGWTVTLSGNEISRAGDMPPVVMVFEGATALFTNNTIRGGGVAAIRVAGTARVAGNKLEGTALRKGGPPNFGVWALSGARVEMTGNSVSGWRHALSAENAEIIARDTTVKDAITTAFRVRGPKESNDVSGNHISGENAKEVIFDSETK
jgi:parallel beta-helix repeat protein